MKQAYDHNNVHNNVRSAHVSRRRAKGSAQAAPAKAGGSWAGGGGASSTLQARGPKGAEAAAGFVVGGPSRRASKCGASSGGGGGAGSRGRISNSNPQDPLGILAKSHRGGCGLGGPAAPSYAAPLRGSSRKDQGGLRRHQGKVHQGLRGGQSPSYDRPKAQRALWVAGPRGAATRAAAGPLAGLQGPLQGPAAAFPLPDPPLDLGQPWSEETADEALGRPFANLNRAQIVADPVATADSEAAGVLPGDDTERVRAALEEQRWQLAQLFDAVDAGGEAIGGEATPDDQAVGPGRRAGEVKELEQQVAALQQQLSTKLAGRVKPKVESPAKLGRQGARGALGQGMGIAGPRAGRAVAVPGISRPPGPAAAGAEDGRPAARGGGALAATAHMGQMGSSGDSSHGDSHATELKRPRQSRKMRAADRADKLAAISGSVSSKPPQLMMSGPGSRPNSIDKQGLLASGPLLGRQSDGGRKAAGGGKSAALSRSGHGKSGSLNRSQSFHGFGPSGGKPSGGKGVAIVPANASKRGPTAGERLEGGGPSVYMAVQKSSPVPSVRSRSIGSIGSIGRSRTDQFRFPH